MKQLKHFALLGALLFSFIACNEDYDEVQTTLSNEHHHYKIETKTFEELSKSEKFTTAFAKLPKQQKQNATASLSKTVMEVDYGFTIADVPAKVMSDDEITSYTFLIYRDSVSDAYFENLVVQTDTTNTTKAVIVKYNLNSPVTYSEAHDSYYIDAEKEVTPIVYNDTPVDGKVLNISITGDCMTIVESFCNYGGSTHSAGDKCQNTYNVSTTICGLGGGSGGSAGSGYGDGGASGSTTGGSTTGTVATTPVFGGGGAPAPPVNCNNDPCCSVKTLFNIPNSKDLKSIINNDLQTDIPNNTNGEKGAYFYHYNGQLNSTIIPPTNTTQINIRPACNVGSQTYVFAAIHTHPKTAYPMFSFSDVYTMANLQSCLQGANQNFMAPFLLTCIDDNNVPQTYAIMFDNASDSLNGLFNNPENVGCSINEILLKFNEKLEDKYFNEETNNTPANRNYEKVFLNFIAGLGINVSLYKANSSLTNFSKLTLNNGVVTPVNCN